MEIRTTIPDDLEPVRELCSAFLGKPYKADWMRTAWERPDFAGFVVEREGTLVGYASLGAGGEFTLWPLEHETAAPLLEAVEARARERGDELISSLVPERHTAIIELLRDSGFARLKEIWQMERELDGDLPGPSWPDGVTIRAYRDEDARAVHELLDRAYDWDETYVPLAHDDWLTWMTGHDGFDHDVWLMAERDNELIGVGLHWKEGWVKDLAVAESARRQGLGEAILLHGFRELQRRGVAKVGLKVDSDNATGAWRLYERAGMRVTQTIEAWSKRL